MEPDDIEYAVIHCSYTKPSMDIGVKEIDRWHRQRGWLGIGYHFVIRRDGTREHGRPVHKPGAHTMNYNSKSIGICMVGGMSEGGEDEDNFTDHQWDALFDLLHEVQTKLPTVKIVGHNELASYKTCPCFDVQVKVVPFLK